eukprot:scaffold208649_cov24-Attheya_sp.AAC.2
MRNRLRTSSWQQVVDMQPYVANLDEEGDEDIDNVSDDTMTAADDDAGIQRPSAVMQTYLKAVQGRLKLETSGNATGQCLNGNGTWLMLMEHLKGNDWWLRKEKAQWVCGKLHVQFSEPEYYRDILIWLPDVLWGAVALPSCGQCKTNGNVSPHAYRTNHFARRIISLSTCYYTMSWRYICHKCKAEYVRQKQQIENAAARTGMEVTAFGHSLNDEIHYTFMGWNEMSL